MTLASRLSPIETTGTLCPIYTIGMGAEVRIREGKTAPDGRPTYSSGTILMVESKDGSVNANKTASVHVVEAPANEYQLGVQYKAEGRVWVMPWENNGRIALSITVERLVLADPKPTSLKAAE